MAATKTTVSPVELSDCPQDGGKWVIFCDHDNGDVGLLQDTNKRRLNSWRTATEVWCPYCQEATK